MTARVKETGPADRARYDLDGKDMGKGLLPWKQIKKLKTSQE